MGYENQEFEIERGPSWARDNWPLTDTDDLTGALDPTQMQVAVKAAAKAQGKAVSDADIAAAAAQQGSALPPSMLLPLMLMLALLSMASLSVAVLL